MKAQELREKCGKNRITYIPHHACGICGEYVGWYLFKWIPYEVVFDPSCGCGHSPVYPDTWEEVAKWVCDDSGEIRERYKEILK